MNTSTPAQLVLQNRAILNMKSQRLGLWFAVITIMITASIVALVVWFGGASGKPVDWETIAAKFLTKVSEDWFEAVAIMFGTVAVFIQFYYVSLAQRHERLTVTGLGINYDSPLPTAIRFLLPSWSLQWSQVRRVKLKFNPLGPNPQLVELIFHAGNQRRSVRPFLWVDAATYQPPSWKDNFLHRVRVLKADAALTEVMNSRLVQFVQSLPKIKIETPHPNNIGAYALEKNPVALGMVILFFVFVVYALADTLFVGHESYVETPYYALYALAGVALCVVGQQWMHRARVPMAESIAVAVLAGAAFGAALYPGLLRINQLTDTDGLTLYEYRMTAPSHFAPLREGLPLLDFPERHAEFWSGQPAGAIEKFELRKGGLGFYQINMRPIYDRIESFYQSGGGSTKR